MGAASLFLSQNPSHNNYSRSAFRNARLGCDLHTRKQHQTHYLCLAHFDRAPYEGIKGKRDNRQGGSLRQTRSRAIMRQSRFMPIAYLSDVTSDVLRASSLVSIHAHPIKPSATRVPALMNPSPRPFPSTPRSQIMNYTKRTLPHSARPAVTSTVGEYRLGGWKSIAHDICADWYRRHRRKTKASRGAMIHDRDALFDDNESRGYSNYSPRLVMSRCSGN